MKKGIIFRFLAYIVTKIVSIIPVFIISIIIFLILCFVSGGFSESGVEIFLVLYIAVMIPSLFADTLYACLNPSSIPDSLITVFLIILFAYILLESLLLMTKKGDLGMIIFKLNLEDKQGNKPRFFKVFLRTTIKYFSIALFPILFIFPLLSMGFYHKKIFLHELASGVYKVPKKNETNINKQVDPEEKLRINNAKKALIVNIIAGCIFSVVWSILLLILKKYDLSDTAIIVYLRIPILIIETLILNLTQKISGKYFWLISLFQIVLFTFVLQKICAAIMW